MTLTVKQMSFNPFQIFKRISDIFPDIGSIINSLLLVGNLGLRLYGTDQLIVSFLTSRLIRIPEIKDFTCSKYEKTLDFHVYVDKPDWEAEEKIFEAYGKLLDLFPDKDIDLKILEMYGRSIEELGLENT